jgi:hypothetical protein
MKMNGGMGVKTHIFLTSAPVGVSGQLHTLVALLLGKGPTVSIGYEVG